MSPIPFHPLTWAIWCGLYGGPPPVSYVEVG
jgi:hypothetical protein